MRSDGEIGGIVNTDTVRLTGVAADLTLAALCVTAGVGAPDSGYV